LPALQNQQRLQQQAVRLLLQQVALSLKSKEPSSVCVIHSEKLKYKIQNLLFHWATITLVSDLI
jgi:hypothetical protein